MDGDEGDFERGDDGGGGSLSPARGQHLPSKEYLGGLLSLGVVELPWVVTGMTELVGGIPWARQGRDLHSGPSVDQNLRNHALSGS